MNTPERLGAQPACMPDEMAVAAPVWRRRDWLRHTTLGLCAPAVAAGWAGCSPPAALAFKGLDVTGATYGRDFLLPDMHGQLRRLADFRGHAVMLYFGFTQCPDVCPTALTRAQAVLTRLGERAAQRVQLLFVTVDPERDTPELLRAYMAAFHPSFLALRGDARQTQATAEEFKVYYQKVPTGSSYTMDHSAQTFLFDPQGQLRVVLRHDQTEADYAADIHLLLSQA